MLIAFYGAMGNAPEGQGALNLMVSALAARASVDSINAALNRCMIECRYPARLPDIFQRIPGLDVDTNAEKRLAWETVERFVAKWLRWNSERTGAYIEPGAPDLSPRILDTVRRSGGWSCYLRMTDEDFPHQQKRFFEEYQAWTEIQYVAADPAKVLEFPKPTRPRELTGTIPAKTSEATNNPEPVTITASVKRVYEPLTADQLRDRAELAKLQLAEWRKKHPTNPEEAQA